MENDLSKEQAGITANVIAPPDVDSKAWIGWLVVICAIALGYALSYSQNSTNDNAYLAGYNATLTAMIAGLMRFMIGKSLSGSRVWISVGIVFSALMLGSHIAYKRNVTHIKTALSEIATTIDTMATEQANEDGTPAPIQSINTTPKAPGDMGVIEGFLKEYYNGIAQIHNDYLKELESIGWFLILDPAHLKADPAQSKSLEMIKSARSIVSVYRRKTIAYIESGKQGIEALDLAPNLKSSMLRGYEKGKSKSLVSIDLQWDYEEKILNEVEKIITLLGARQGKWEVNGDQLLFASEHDLAAYSEGMNAIDEYSKKQAELQKASSNEAKKELQDVDEQMEPN